MLLTTPNSSSIARRASTWIILRRGDLDQPLLGGAISAKLSSILGNSIPNISFFAVFVIASNIILKEEKKPKRSGHKDIGVSTKFKNRP